MKSNKQMFGIALTIVLLSLTLFFMRDFNLVWTEVNQDEAQITINFLIPMDQDALQNHIYIQSNKYYDTNFISDISWSSSTTAHITLKEVGAIKGQEVILIIQNAPTLYDPISKNTSIPVQFQSDVAILSPKDEILVTTQKPFLVQFNTPMHAATLSKYLQSDATFLIEPFETIDENGEVYQDHTCFLFTPKEPLLNDHKYILSFRKGMPSQSGNFLVEPLQITIHTDQKPTISRITPSNGTKWVGLYPRITVESSDIIDNAYLFLNGHSLVGVKKGDHRVDFYPTTVLKANQEYNATASIQIASGEISDNYDFSFTTAPITEDRIWAEVILGNSHEIRVYRGETEINRFVCSGGLETSPTPKGTYYLQEKGESHYDTTYKEGANYPMVLSEGILIHGMTRDAHWTMQPQVYNALGTPQTRGSIVLKEEDAAWLYDHLPLDTMIIIHP